MSDESENCGLERLGAVTGRRRERAESQQSDVSIAVDVVRFVEMSAAGGEGG